MWEEDCKINPMKLDEISARTPLLHSKYLAILSSAKLKLKSKEQYQSILLKKKWLWYNGKMTQEQIEAEGWEYDPLNGLKILKGEMDHYYDSDPEIQKSVEDIHYWKTVVETLESIINNVNWRHLTIKNIIDFKKFEAGY